MSNEQNFREAQGSWQKRRRVALALKIALGQTGKHSNKGEQNLTDDEVEKGFFDMGFEMAYDNGMREIVAVLQGMAAGLDQLLEDSAANDNQMELQFDGNRNENQGKNAGPAGGDS